MERNNALTNKMKKKRLFARTFCETGCLAKVITQYLVQSQITCRPVSKIRMEKVLLLNKKVI